MAAAPVAGASIARQPIAERRMCSVIFCDLVGFTPLSEGRDPEEVRELLSGYFAAARTIIDRYGGVVEKFIGDAVMAVWGAPVASEGDAERAVRAALDVVTAVRQLGVDAGISGLAARAGVVTGEVAVTLGATHEGMVAGDAVNTAARVQSTATADTVLVDGTTRRLAASAIGFDDAGEHLLKGKAEPEPLWRATRVLSGVGGAQRVDGLEAPLTGRDAELRTIKELFHAVSERRMPRLVVVSGPAGVGKSRIGWEFEKYVDGLATEVFWHRGRCLSYGEGVSFWALSEIVRQRLGVAEEDPTEVAATKLAQGLAQYVPDPAEQAYVGPRLARLLGVPFAGDSGGVLTPEELFAGWRLFFERLASSPEPVLLLIEDAQHADSGLLDFIDHLIDWARDLPIFVLMFARPELEQGRPGFGTGRNRTALTLDPLDAASMEAIVDALVPGMDPPARQAITQHSQGIPLFAVETVRALIDRDVVQPVEGVYRLVGDVGELVVPDSLHSLLAARLDALDPEVRQLVADAAVLGSSFTAEALLAVSAQSEDAVRAGLAELLRREVLAVSADRLSPERGSYRFAQDMLRQVAYDTLSRRDRKARHLAVAAHLRATFPNDGEEVMDVVARHYLDALHAVPDATDRTDLHGEAVAALTRSADRAARTGAPARAAASYAEAAELSSQSEATDSRLGAASLWESAAAAASASAAWPTALIYAEHGRQGFLAAGDKRGAARVQVIAGAVLRREGRHGEAREQFAVALEELRIEPDADTVRALNELASLEVFGGNDDSGQAIAEALALGQDLGVSTDLLSDIFTTRGIWLAASERRPESVAYFREAVRLADQTGNNVSAGRALLNLSDSIAGIDPEGAAEAARDAVDRLERTGNVDLLVFARSNLAAALLSLGDWDAVEEVVDESLVQDAARAAELAAIFQAWLLGLRGAREAAKAAAAGLDGLLASEDAQDRAMVELARAFAADPESNEALQLARSVLAHANPLGISSESLRWAWPLAVRVAHEHRDDAALQELLAQLDQYRDGQLAPMQRAERDLVRARIAAVQGDPEAAAGMVAAITSLREQSTPYHLAHGLLDHAEYLLAGGDADAAAGAIDEARELGQRLRCQPLLDRADSIGVRTAV